jgi:tetratricopeptide (TPR) repeat protein
MSRFSNLEFGDPHKRESTGTPMKDEAFYLAEATQAFEQGRFELALRNYGKMLEYNPQSAPAWNGQVRMLIEMGEFREARVWADKALEFFPQDPELLAAKAVALGRSGDTQAALAYSDASMEMKGDSPYVWLARGDVLLARKEKRAEHCFIKALAAAPGSWIMHWLAARIHHHYERFASALKYAQRALELDTTRAVLWLQAGLCQQQLGLYGAAENSLSHAVELDANCREADLALNELNRAGIFHRLGGWWRKTFGS